MSNAMQLSRLDSVSYAASRRLQQSASKITAPRIIGSGIHSALLNSHILGASDMAACPYPKRGDWLCCEKRLLLLCCYCRSRRKPKTLFQAR
jgi:hypothetical protein